MTRRVWSGLAMAIALASMTAGGVVITQGGGTPPVAGVANAWANTSAQTCTRSATPITFAQAQTNGWVCGPNWDNAWDVAQAGDTIRVRPGSYGDITLTGAKASETWIIGETGVEISTLDTPNHGTDGTWLHMQDVVIDNGSSWAYVTGMNGNNMTFTNVDIYGSLPTMASTGTNNKWEDSDFLENNSASGVRDCPMQEPMYLLNTTNFTVDNITFYSQQAAIGNSVCSGDSTYHLEYIRCEGCLNLTVKNSHFHAGDAGSGYIFFTGFAGFPNSSGVKLINNVFEPLPGFNWTIDTNTSVTNCSNWVIAYNSWQNGWEHCANNGGGGNQTGWVVVGNIGSAICPGTNIRNVWYGSGSCGSDTYLGAGTTFTSLGIDPSDDYTLLSSSPAINGAETPSATDYCTDPNFVNSLDLEGTPRPQGSICDAGPDERNP